MGAGRDDTGGEEGKGKALATASLPALPAAPLPALPAAPLLVLLPFAFELLPPLWRGVVPVRVPVPAVAAAD